MIIVCLDQCAVSCLARRQSSRWENVRTILEDGLETERIFCPLPPETLLETARCGDRTLGLEIEAFFSKVSGGYRFRDFGELIIDNSIALTRSTLDVEYLKLIDFHGWAEQAPLLSSLARFHEDGRKRLSDTISQHLYPREAKTMSLDTIFYNEAKNRSDMLRRDITLFLDGVRSKEKFEIPWLMEGLAQNKMSDSEAKHLNEKVLNGEWIQIMENKLDLLLACKWSHDVIIGQRQKHHPNDEIDRWRAVVGLLCAHLFVTDKSATAHCRRVASLVNLPVKIIAVNRPEEIISFLQANQ